MFYNLDKHCQETNRISKSKLRCIAPKTSNGYTLSNSVGLAKRKIDRTADEPTCTSAELLIKLPTGEMLPLSKLPVTKENRIGEYSLTNAACSNDVSGESASQMDGSRVSNLNPGVDVTYDPKQRLKDMLEGKPESSYKVASDKSSSDPIISLVQV